MLNLSGVLKLETFAQPFIIRRSALGQRNEYGEFFTDEPDVEIPVIGSVQPLSGRDRLNLPEAERVTEGIVAYIKNDINVESLRVGIDQTDGDTIIYKGIRYLIRSVKDWNVHGHYKIIATRVEGQNG